MTHAHRPQLSLPRLLALCLACICLWMGTVGTTGHTDTLRVGGPASAQADVHHAAKVVLADACVACQWTQGLQSQSLAVFCFAAPLDALALLLVSLAAALVLRVLRCRSPRAPPVRFSA